MNGRPRILDGGLATTLEARGHALHPQLWSAGVFLSDPGAVEEVHLEFLRAGAEILTGASYQMSFEGLARAGLDHGAAADAMRRTVAVARAAIRRHGRAAMVAASVGPYGAVLADGSEYLGRYGLDDRSLAEFHRERLSVLAVSGADLLAIETIPCLQEARVLLALLEELPWARAWISFTCRDGTHLRDGSPLAEAARLAEGSSQVRALGVNCTSPALVDSALEEIRRVSSKPLVVYPNSGETWRAADRTWHGQDDPGEFCRLALGWAHRGAWAIGGCCRVSPETIRALSAALSGALGQRG